MPDETDFRQCTRVMAAIPRRVARRFFEKPGAFVEPHCLHLAASKGYQFANLHLKTLGGHVEQCDACGRQRIAFYSCRDRHCPKCQSLVRARWLQDRQAERLPVEYLHVVFTVPQQIAAIAYQNKTVVYDILSRATAETLRTIAADPKQLGAEIGFIAVLHTWGQTLMHYPHLHCVVPGGGVSLDGQRWIACRPGFFLPVRMLSALFWRLFLTQLRQAVNDKALHFFNAQAELQDAPAFA